MKTALLLIDPQNDYFPGGKMELVSSEVAVVKTRKLLDTFRQQRRLVIGDSLRMERQLATGDRMRRTSRCQ